MQLYFGQMNFIFAKCNFILAKCNLILAKYNLILAKYNLILAKCNLILAKCNFILVESYIFVRTCKTIAIKVKKIPLACNWLNLEPGRLLVKCLNTKWQ